MTDADVAKAAAFGREATRLMAHHIYRSGLREEWLHEDDDTEAVYLRVSDASLEALTHPANAGELDAVVDLLQSLRARVSRWSQLHCPLHRKLIVHFGKWSVCHLQPPF